MSEPRQTIQKQPGRPRSFDRDGVLDSALELFWKSGYRSTTTRELEAALGLSQSSISNSFGTKQDLLSATLDRYENLADRELLQPLEQSHDGLGAIATFISEMRRWVAQEGRRGCLLINMMAEDGGVTESITQRAAVYRERVRSALRKRLMQADIKGETRQSLPDERADLLMGLVLGLNIAARGGAPAAELDRMTDAVHSQIANWRV